MLACNISVDHVLTYEEVSQASLQGMGLLQPDGIILAANRPLAAALGVATPERLAGRNIRELFSLRQPLTWDALLSAALSGAGVPQRQTVQGTGQDATTRWLDLLVTRSVRQGSTTLLLTCLDVTAQHQMETQGRQHHRLHALGTLAGGIAHDFNNMLAAILGYTELLMDDIPQESLAWHRLQRVLSAGERAKELVRQILYVSRQQEQERRPIQLGLLIEEVLKLLQASLPVTITIHPSVPPQVGTVLAEPTQMYQVLMNLCINAEHALRPRGGVIDIRLEDVDLRSSLPACTGTLAPGPYVCLTVRDTGVGMTADILDQIFEPFFTTKGPEEGSGMGLTVVEGIIRQHDGAITVSSCPGHGTTFAVYLPRFDTPALLPVPREEPVPGGSERILFVDDEEAIARLGCMLLERLGYEVVVSTSSREALEIFRTAAKPFDLVITDYTMPLMTGAVLAQELRRLRPELPLILCSGFSHTMNTDKALSLGVDAFLLKPFLYRDLARSVRQALAAHQSPQT
ncbi:MAG: ATP-binding protein [Candidatus Tectimicrobiota bacterium]